MCSEVNSSRTNKARRMMQGMSAATETTSWTIKDWLSVDGSLKSRGMSLAPNRLNLEEEGPQHGQDECDALC